MATAKKLPSGAWRCLAFDYTDANGKRRYKSFTASTKKEAEYMAASYKLTNTTTTGSGSMPLKTAMQSYCDAKANVLSPATHKDYIHMISRAYEPIGGVPLSKISTEMVQRWVNTYSVGRSPKTVHNAYSFLHATLAMYSPHMTLNGIKLPQKVKTKLYVPTDEDVQRLIAYIDSKDKTMLVAVYLAAFGALRRSEICGLTADDVKGNKIIIDKAMVQDADKNWRIKTTKTTSSTREIEMPDYIINILPKSGRLVDLPPNVVTSRFNRALGKLGIPHFRFHDLRHYCASVMHALGIPDVYIMQRGGWGSDGTLQRVYRGVMDDYQVRYTDRILDHFDNMQHKIQHKEKKTT